MVAALMVIIGGFRYVTAAGNEEGSKKGLKMVQDAAIGLALAILAYAIIAIVTNTVSSLSGSSSTSSTTTRRPRQAAQLQDSSKYTIYNIQ